jgi:hypothetical protein
MQPIHADQRRSIVNLEKQLQQLQQLQGGYDARIRRVEEGHAAHSQEVNKHMSDFLGMLKMHDEILQVKETDLNE